MGKTKVLTTLPQPQQQSRIRGGVTVDVLDRASPHKRFDCLLHLERCLDAKVDVHPQIASRPFHANQWILTDRHASFASKLDISISIWLSLQWFVLLQGTRRFFKNDFNNIASSKRGRPTWCHRLVTTLACNLAWLECTGCTIFFSAPFQYVQQYSEKRWSAHCLVTYSKQAKYAANLPPHKWLGCMLCTANTGNHTSDLAQHPQTASKAFYAHRLLLVIKNVTMRNRFGYFDAMVTPVACFGAAHKTILRFAYHVPLLSHLVTWIGRCHGMKSFTIGMNEWNFYWSSS